MNLLSLLALGLPILTGTLLIHLVWIGKNQPIDLILKISLGTGMGLGISSLLYFVCLIFFDRGAYFIFLELAMFFAALIVIVFKNKEATQIQSPRLGISFLQILILIIAGSVFAASFLGVVNYASQRVHGDWDAWMIYNRAARFIYRGQEAWQDAFSKDMDVIFHADYPPLLSLNIASRWALLNEETSYVPMFQSIFFSLASLGLCFSALASLKSLGQAGLGIIFLGGVSLFLGEGGRQTADVPLAFYILASIVFLFFCYQEGRPVLIVYTGFSMGLAAWTKNEGMLFLFVSAGIMVIAAIRKGSFHGLFFFFAGLFLPLVLLLYFKFQLAPPSEFLVHENGVIMQNLLDTSRHRFIFNSFKNFILHSGGWNNIGVFVVLCLYFLLFRIRVKDNQNAVFISLAIFAFQIMGYYFIYLISPYDLEWHVSFSLNRLFVHIYPALVFVILITSQPPETVFSSGAE